MPSRAAVFVFLALLSAGCAGAAGPVGKTDQPRTSQSAVVLPSQSTCTLLTADDMSAIWGVKMSAVPGTDNECTWLASTGLPTMSIRFEASDIDSAGALLGNRSELTVRGRRAVIGNLPGGLIVYVEVDSADLVVQTVQLPDSVENRQKLTATAEKAASRFK